MLVALAAAPAAGAEADVEPLAPAGVEAVDVDRALDGSPTPDGDGSWRPPDPPDDKYDWVQLTSGEWLKGEILRMRDDDLEFDSDKLDELTIDWDDIAQIRASRPQQWVNVDHTVLVGRAVVDRKEVRVWTEDGVKSFPSEDLLSVVPAAERLRDRWDSKISLGVSVNQGNTDQADFSGFGHLRRATALTRFLISYNGAISVVGDQKTTNNHRATARFDIWLTDRLFLTPAMVDAYHDEFQNIGLRLTPGATVGYRIADMKNFVWEVDLGGGAQHTRPVSSDADAKTIGATLTGTRVDWDITDDIEWEFTYRFQLGIPGVDERTHHTFTTLSFEITDHIDFDLSLTWDRTSKPPPLADGTTPESDDVRFSVGLGFDL